MSWNALIVVNVGSKKNGSRSRFQTMFCFTVESINIMLERVNVTVKFLTKTTGVSATVSLKNTFYIHSTEPDVVNFGKRLVLIRKGDEPKNNGLNQLIAFARFLLHYDITVTVVEVLNILIA